MGENGEKNDLKLDFINLNNIKQTGLKETTNRTFTPHIEHCIIYTLLNTV